MSKALRNIGVLILLVGFALLIHEVHLFSSARRFTLTEALAHIIHHAYGILGCVVLIVGGIALMRKAGERDDTDVLEERPKRRPCHVMSDDKDIVKHAVLLAVLLYSIYVLFHVLVSASQGCNVRSTLITLFPIRQLYLIPTIERDLSIGTVESLASADSGASLLGAAIAGQLNEPIMDVVRHGSCADFYRITGRSDELLTRQRQMNPPTATPFNRKSPGALTAEAFMLNLTSTPIVPEPTQTPEPKTCFPYGTAYVTGNMNIRESATTKSPVVRTTDPKEIYKVSEVKQGDPWCWLKVTGGWMAVTSYVSHDIASILPSIEGDIRFKNKMTKGFEFLAQKSSRWFQYTVQIIHSVTQADLSSDDALASVINDGTGRVNVDNKAIIKDAAYLSSVFIHEACHLYQHKDTSRRRSFLGHDEEKECYGIQARSLSDIQPRHEMIERLRCAARGYPFTSWC